MVALIPRVSHWFRNWRRSRRPRTTSHRRNRAPTATATATATSEPAAKSPTASPQIAYLMSGFPHLTETFILFEMLAVQQEGIALAIYPLRRAPMRVAHPEVAAVLPQVRFHPLLSWPILCAHAYFLRRAPRAYFGALWTWLRATCGSLRYFAGALAFFPKAVYWARTMRAEGITHIHAHFASHPAAAAFVIHRLTGIPYSFTAHGSDLHRERRMLREKVAEAAFVVTISEYNRRWILAECGEACRDKVLIVPCGVDLRVFQPSQASPSRPDRPLAIACVGTLYEVKGQTYLLEACAVLRDRGVPFSCHLVGDGPDRKMLLRQVEKAGLCADVHFHGTLTRPAIATILRRSDVLVTPSVISRDGRREGKPNVLMEAMACGLPVVASRLSGIPELVEHQRTGFLTPPGDALAIADALETLAGDPGLRARLGTCAREMVLRHHDLHANAARLVQLFVAHGVPGTASDISPTAAERVCQSNAQEGPPCTSR